MSSQITSNSLPALPNGHPSCTDHFTKLDSTTEATYCEEVSWAQSFELCQVQILYCWHLCFQFHTFAFAWMNECPCLVCCWWHWLSCTLWGPFLPSKKAKQSNQRGSRKFPLELVTISWAVRTPSTFRPRITDEVLKPSWTILKFYLLLAENFFFVPMVINFDPF